MAKYSSWQILVDEDDESGHMSLRFPEPLFVAGKVTTGTYKHNQINDLVDAGVFDGCDFGLRLISALAGMKGARVLLDSAHPKRVCIMHKPFGGNDVRIQLPGALREVIGVGVEVLFKDTNFGRHRHPKAKRLRRSSAPANPTDPAE